MTVVNHPHKAKDKEQIATELELVQRIGALAIENEQLTKKLVQWKYCLRKATERIEMLEEALEERDQQVMQ